MPVPRKVFRIENSASRRLDEAAETAQAGLRYAEIMVELRALRRALAAVAPWQPQGLAASHGAGVARLTSQLNLIAGAIKSGDGNSAGPDPTARSAASPEGSDAKTSLPQKPAPESSPSRIDHELAAVVSSTEQATQKILAAAEDIDSTANTLSAALAGRIEQELAQDIQDSVIHIFEACNFQDLIGQRVAKVSAAVKFVEENIARVLEEIHTAAAAQTLHGPCLDGDRGHASQDDVDAMFAERASGE
jgi:chemotaxis protein CheZ